MSDSAGEHERTLAFAEIALGQIKALRSGVHPAQLRGSGTPTPPAIIRRSPARRAEVREARESYSGKMRRKVAQRTLMQCEFALLKMWKKIQRNVIAALR